MTEQARERKAWWRSARRSSRVRRAAESLEPGKEPFHDPAVVPELLARFDAAPGDARFDAAPAQRVPAFGMVIGLVRAWSFSGRRRGRPPARRHSPGTASTTASRSWQSLRLPEERSAASGGEWRSPTRFVALNGHVRERGWGMFSQWVRPGGSLVVAHRQHLM